MFCWVCRFRVRVLESYRTSRSFGYGYGNVTEITEVPGIVTRAYIIHRSSARVQKLLYPYPGYCGTDLTELTEAPGTGMIVLHNLHRFRVRVLNTPELPELLGIGVQNLQSSRYGYESRTELTEVMGTGMPECPTELTEFPGTGNTRVKSRRRGRSSI